MAVLADLERLFERVFDRTTARLFRAHPQPVQLERRVERAMERARTAHGGRVEVPARYRVRLHPTDLADAADAVGDAEALAGRLADAALAFARSHDYHLASRPTVALVADPAVAAGVIEVDAVSLGARAVPRPGDLAPASAAPAPVVEASAGTIGRGATPSGPRIGGASPVAAEPVAVAPVAPSHLVPDVPIVGSRPPSAAPVSRPDSPSPRSASPRPQPVPAPAAGPVPWIAPSPPAPAASMFDVARPPTAAVVPMRVDVPGAKPADPVLRERELAAADAAREGPAASGAAAFAAPAAETPRGALPATLAPPPSPPIAAVPPIASVPPVAPAPPAGPVPRQPTIRDPTETLVFRRPAPAPTRAVLRVQARDGSERTIEVDGTPLTVGRSADNALVLPDPRVSRHHARLQARRGRLVLTDLGSTNGSRVNGVRVDECALGTGDRVVVGDTVLLVEQLPG